MELRSPHTFLIFYVLIILNRLNLKSLANIKSLANVLRVFGIGIVNYCTLCFTFIWFGTWGTDNFSRRFLRIVTIVQQLFTYLLGDFCLGSYGACYPSQRRGLQLYESKHNLQAGTYTVLHAEVQENAILHARRTCKMAFSCTEACKGYKNHQIKILKAEFQ